MAMRKLTHQKMELFLRCRNKFRQTVSKKTGDVTPAEQIARVVGKAVELATATTDVEERQIIIDTALEQLDAEQIPEALQRVESCVSNSDKIRSTERRSKVRAQRQFEWFDDVTQWSLMAKPDFVRFARDSKGCVIQVIDEKTAGHVTSYQKRFLHFLGFVIGKQLEHEKRVALDEAKRYDISPTYTIKPGSFLAEVVNEFGIDNVFNRPVSIELIIRLLGTSDIPDEEPREVSIGFKKRARDWEQLKEIRDVIEGIEAAFDEDNFPGKTGWYCDNCPFRNTCAAFQAEVERQAQQQALLETA